MTEVKNECDIEIVASKMSKIAASCTKLWLPLSDEKMEGFWENTNEGTKASLLKWADGQPNGLRVQNHAALYIETLDFGDFVSGALECVSCKLSTMAVLTLRGVCKDSYLGKKFGQTRPKPAYSRQGLDWIVGPGYSFVVFSTNKTMETNHKP